jgi:MFS family permease
MARGELAARPSRELRLARAGVAAAFLLTGAVFGTWSARLPAIKQDLGLSDGQLALAFIGLNAGAVLGLQLGGMLVPRVGSRPALRLALPALACALAAPALAWDLLALTAGMVVFAATNSVVDVAMNAHGVALERGYGRPLLSGLHAMHSLGGIVGAGLAALAAALGLALAPHFLAVAALAAVAAVAATHPLLPSQVDVAGGRAGGGERPGGVLAGWLRGWSGRVLALGALGFCLMLAEGSAYDWGAVYLRDDLGTSHGIAAAGVAGFLAAMTAGRLAGDRLAVRLGPARAFRVGGIVAGTGLGAALVVDAPATGLLGLAFLGAGLSFTLPLALSAAGHLRGGAAAAVARVSTLSYLGSFVGPAIIGALAGPLGLPAALGLPALLVGATALGARAVAPPSAAEEQARAGSGAEAQRAVHGRGGRG